MTADTLGRFAEGFTGFRRMMANSPEPTRLQVFMNAAKETASYVAKGLDRVAAADELTEIATSFGFDDRDAVQFIIGNAFQKIVEPDRVPDEIIEPDRPPAKPNGKHPQPPRIRLLSDFMTGFVPPDFIIDGLLQRRFVYSLTGQTGHAKSAIALLVSELVSSPDRNTMLGVHKVNKGQVLYFVGENADDIRMRLIGSIHDASLHRLYFIEGVFNIGQMFAQIREQVDRLGGFDLVVIDTSAAYFLGNEELSNTQMGAHARMLRSLTLLPGGPCVLVLCHPIKHVTDPTQLLPRGGGAFLAEIDGNLTSWKHDDVLIELHHNKMRGPGFEPISFKLETIRTPKLVDARGRELPTVRAVPVTQSEEDTQRKRTEDDEDHVLAEMLAHPEASFSEIAESCGWVNGHGEALKKRVGRAIDRLQNAKPKLVRKNRNRWELTDEGKTQARKAALAFEQARIATDQKTMF